MIKLLPPSSRTVLALTAALAIGTGATTLRAELPDRSKGGAPLMRDFIGINGDYNFKPELFSPICRLYRMYQPGHWDLEEDTAVLPNYPMAKNGVNWEDFYGKMQSHGFVNDACLQIDQIKPENWKDIKKDGFAYAEAFAKFFGPSGKNLVESAEIGNEPADWNDEQYRIIFEAMGKGFRAGDPKLKIVTATAIARKGDQWSKSVKAFEGLEQYYDVLNVHTYAFTEGWPSWKRSFPEDPAAENYLKDITDMVKYRDEKAPGKEVWVTEFGYDSSSQPPEDPKFLNVTETQHAQWLTRSLLVFSTLGIERAYVYFHNDNDKNSFHAASGLTRKNVPKPAYYALAHLYKTLGDYRFTAITSQSRDLLVYEYVNPAKPKEPIWVAWSPTGSDQASSQSLQLPPGAKVLGAERMPLKEGELEQVKLSAQGSKLEVPVTESPLYVRISR